MDRILQTAWQRNEKPFHSETICLDIAVSISTLRKILTSVLNYCEEMYPPEYVQLYAFDDWHTHDGYISESRLTNLQELSLILNSDDSFYQSRHHDYDVWRAFYPNSLDFLCRYEILLDQADEEPFDDIYGFFSFTGYGFDLHEMMKRLISFEGVPFRECL